MTNPTSNFGWQMPTSTDLVTDLPADFETFGQAVDTSLADLKGGTSGQVLSKASNTDMDFTWVTSDDANAIQNTIVDAKGDLIAATAADTPARLAVGANNTVLIADSAEATGLRWGGGWAAYTPTTSGITIGNGTLQARYAQIGKTVFVEIFFTLGSTSAVTGTPNFSIPVTAKVSSYTFMNGTVSLGDYGAATYVGLAGNPTGSGIYVAAFNTAGSWGVEAGSISATVPFTWTTNDYIAVKMTYEAA